MYGFVILTIFIYLGEQQQLGIGLKEMVVQPYILYDTVMFYQRKPDLCFLLANFLHTHFIVSFYFYSFHKKEIWKII